MERDWAFSPFALPLAFALPDISDVVVDWKKFVESLLFVALAFELFFCSLSAFTSAPL